MLTLFSPTDGVVAFFEKLVERLSSVHVLEEFSLHLILCESSLCQLRQRKDDMVYLLDEVQHDRFWYHVNHGTLDNVVVRVDEEFYHH